MYKQVRTSENEIYQIGILRLIDNAFIPFDPANSDYQRYLKWLDGYEETPDGWVKTSDGNTPLPADQE
jgi:hypothetical protein